MLSLILKFQHYEKGFYHSHSRFGGGNTPLNVTADPNISYQPRSTTLNISASGITKSVMISQGALISSPIFFSEIQTSGWIQPFKKMYPITSFSQYSDIETGRSDILLVSAQIPSGEKGCFGIMVSNKLYDTLDLSDFSCTNGSVYPIIKGEKSLYGIGSYSAIYVNLGPITSDRDGFKLMYKNEILLSFSFRIG